ncbi:hypothetical protein [Pseudomonas syringae]|nr:hypothetical protein [Pseudomonas syringae]
MRHKNASGDEDGFHSRLRDTYGICFEGEKVWVGQKVGAKSRVGEDMGA